MAASGAAPNSSITAYAVGADVTAARSWTQLADLVVDATTRNGTVTPLNSEAAVIATFTTTDGLGYRALRWASGQIEAAVTAGLRYRPEDLQELMEAQVIPTAQGGNGTTTAYMVGRDLLVGLCCDLAFWWLIKRRKPGAKPDQVAGVGEALDMLERLRLGEIIFPIASTQDAGLAEVVPLDAETDVTTAAEPVSLRASRLFGWRR